MAKHPGDRNRVVARAAPKPIEAALEAGRAALPLAAPKPDATLGRVRHRYPQAYQIHATPGPLDAVVEVPGSKSVTNRALLCAALARGDSELARPLCSDDTEAMLAGLRSLGVSAQTAGDPWRIAGSAGHLRAPGRPVNARGSGTTARFLCAAAALADGPVVIDGNARMRARPIDDLTRALGRLGVGVEEFGATGCPPVRIHGGSLAGGGVAIDASRSSQFVSALLLAAPCAKSRVEIALDGTIVSRPYIDLTLQVMGRFGAEAGWRGPGGLTVEPTGYRGCRFEIEPDATAATYAFAAAAIAGGRVRLRGIPPDSAQGDFAFLELLEEMGCAVRRVGMQVEVERGERPLRGIDADLNAIPDTALTLAVIALFAEGETRIRNVANLRIKETDRLDALERELRKLGADATAGPDWLEIRPVPSGEGRAAAIDTYDDHRMAMAFSLAGLRIPGVEIRDPACVSKTWPGYFEAMQFLGATPT